VNFKGLGLGLLATGVGAAAAEVNPAAIEAIKHIGTVCGAVYALGSAAKLVAEFARWYKAHQVAELKQAIRDELEERLEAKLKFLPCVTNGKCEEGG